MSDPAGELLGVCVNQVQQYCCLTTVVKVSVSSEAQSTPGYGPARSGRGRPEGSPGTAAPASPSPRGNVSPALVENILKEHPLIGQALVHGDGRSCLMALLVLDPETVPAWAAARGIDVAASAPAGARRGEMTHRLPVPARTLVR